MASKQGEKWEDKFNVLKQICFKTDDNKEWKFSVEEHKQKGTLQLNARCFTIATKEGGYSGPSKNGFILPINSIEDLDKIQDCFSTFISFIDDVKTLI